MVGGWGSKSYFVKKRFSVKFTKYLTTKWRPIQNKLYKYAYQKYKWGPWQSTCEFQDLAKF